LTAQRENIESKKFQRETNKVRVLLQPLLNADWTPLAAAAFASARKWPKGPFLFTWPVKVERLCHSTTFLPFSSSSRVAHLPFTCLSPVAIHLLPPSCSLAFGRFRFGFIGRFRWKPNLNC
jgi:hypothetical protein